MEATTANNVRRLYISCLSASWLALSITACGEPGNDIPTAGIGDTAAVPSTTPSTSAVSDLPTSWVDVEDRDFATVEKLAAASDSIVVGTVTSISSLSRPSEGEDPFADEYLAITVDVADTIKGEPLAEVTLGWDAFGTDAEGERQTQLLLNGVEAPQLGDQLLLYLVAPDPLYDEFLDGVPTHDPVALDGVMTIVDDRVAEGEKGSRAVQQLLGTPLDEVIETLIAL